MIKIRARNVGQCFATIGEAIDRNGRVVYETHLFPYGCAVEARDAVRRWCAERHIEVGQ